MTAPIALLFDIDGTLLLAGGAGRKALNLAFEELYHQKGIFDGIDPMGRTDISLIRQCFEERLSIKPSTEQIHQIKEIYIKILPEMLKDAPCFRLMPYVLETLTVLKQKYHLEMGIATGNFKQSGYLKLNKAGIDHFFSFGGFGCDSEKRDELTIKAVKDAKNKTGADHDHIYVIGDTIHDVTSGKAAGVKTIAVCTGYTKREELELGLPTAVLDNFGPMGQSLIEILQLKC